MEDGEQGQTGSGATGDDDAEHEETELAPGGISKLETAGRKWTRLWELSGVNQAVPLVAGRHTGGK